MCCMLIHKPAGVKLDQSIYDECWRGNNDGLGLAFVDPEKNILVVEKGFINRKDAMEAISSREHLELMIHFRKMSRGAVTKENCHPFMIETHKDEALVPRYMYAVGHNGTIDIKTKDCESDTLTFVRAVLTPWLEEDPLLFEYGYKRFVFEGCLDKRALGTGIKSKMVIFRWDNELKDLQVIILNKDAGNESHGCWFSSYNWMTTEDWQKRFQPDEAGYGYGAMGAMGMFRGRNMRLMGGRSEPNKQDTREGEHFTDHLGWRWDEKIKMFVNEKTKCQRDELTYRKAWDDIYKIGGQTYHRTKQNWDANGVSYAIEDKKTTQTTIPNVIPIKPGHVSDEEISNEEWKDQLRMSNELKEPTLKHLDKKQRRVMKRIAWDYCKMTIGPTKAKAMKMSDQIILLRASFMDESPGNCPTSMFELMDMDVTIMTLGVIGDDDVPKTTHNGMHCS